MKVNISYAVDLERVPQEVGKLIDSCEGMLRALHADVDMIHAANPLEAINQIGSIRKLLADLDVRLGDCSNILNGYLELQSKLAAGTDSVSESEDNNAE